MAKRKHILAGTYDGLSTASAMLKTKKHARSSQRLQILSTYNGEQITNIVARLIDAEFERFEKEVMKTNPKRLEATKLIFDYTDEPVNEDGDTKDGKSE